MIEAMQVSVQSLGEGEVYALQEQGLTPGWYVDGLRGRYYLSADGIRYYSNLITGQAVVPTAFFAEYEYPATSIGGPLYVVKGDNVRVNWSFKWQGSARTIRLRMGGCVKVIANYDEIGASVVTTDVSVTASTTPKTYSGSTTFPYQYSANRPKHLFILPEGIEYDVVYTDAFVEITAEFKDLKITSYARA